MPFIVKEELFGPFLRGPLTTQTPTTNPWAGRLSTLSGTATYSVATTLVGSDSIIRARGQSFVGSNVAQVIKVNSISPGSGFFLTVTPAQVGRESIVMWEVVR